ncbi:MAG TPA: SDR family NAD(P)-dependent oxidoreductase [Urbifossiella sp.]|nr:SDR family NAD(P)-dependent oxidoreductase [Urbifossiella sp.]
MAGANLTAVVTGASSGIGRALAVALARQGWRVGAVARRADLLEELARDVRGAGGVIETAVADVADRAGLAAAVQGLERTLGPVELLIANAGMGGDTGAVQMNVPQVEAIMRVNFLGVVYAIEAVLPGMIARGRGHLVGISSVAAFKGLPGAAAYCASKAAVNAYLEGLRIELRKHGVAVTAVCPGFVRTPMVAKNPPMPFLMEPDAAAERILRALPRRPKVFAFPWRMKLLMRLARWAPDRFIARKVKMKLQ